MRKLGSAIAAVAVLGAGFLRSVEPATEPAYSSKKPLYAKVALTEDGSKVLTVVFDESKGTGKGYDAIYADADLSRKLDRDDRVQASPYVCPSGVHYYFPPIGLKVSYNDKGAGISDACQVTLSCEKHYSQTGASARLLTSSGLGRATEDFFVSTSIRLRDGSTEREYSFKQSMRPSPSPDGAPVASFPRKPVVAISTKPDELNKGNLGIALDLSDGEARGQAPAGGAVQSAGCGCAATQARFQTKPPINAHVEIKTPDGKVVHQDDAALDKFTFG
jgi:hypothetical protein